MVENEKLVFTGSRLIGFDTELDHEKKVFQMVKQGSQLERNVDLNSFPGMGAYSAELLNGNCRVDDKSVNLLCSEVYAPSDIEHYSIERVCNRYISSI
jgi:hypothetical protein